MAKNAQKPAESPATETDVMVPTDVLVTRDAVEPAAVADVPVAADTAGAADAAVTAVLSDAPTAGPVSAVTAEAPTAVLAPALPEAIPAFAPVPAVAAVGMAPRPTIRWGALVWALLFGTLAAFALWVLVDPARIDAVGAWLTALSPLAAVLYAVVIVGVVIALFGIVGLIRRGERQRRR